MGHLKGNAGRLEGHQSMVFTRFRAHVQICMKGDDENRLQEALQMNLELVR